MTPGFIDLSFVNRGYHLVSPLKLPKIYIMPHFLRNLAATIDEVTSPFGTYSEKFNELYVGTMTANYNRHVKLNNLAQVYINNLRSETSGFYNKTSTSNSNESTDKNIPGSIPVVDSQDFIVSGTSANNQSTI